MKNKRKPITASELMDQLNRDPEFVRRSEEREKYFSALAESLALAEKPLVEALNDSGLAVKSVWDLVNTKRTYPEAIPILVAHLERPYPYRIREGIARALTVKYAGEDAFRALLNEFKKVPATGEAAREGFKWALGNAISIVANARHFDEVVGLIRDKRHGTARDAMVLRLPRLNRGRAVSVLIESLADPDVAGHAVTALRKLKVPEARPHIERLLDDPKAWVRKEAAKALAELAN
jgi:HEAT repeat protein